MIRNDCFKGPQDLFEKIDSGRWIILVARNSGSGGKRARELAADELYKTAEGLRTKVGIDLLASLPSKASVLAALTQAKSIKSISSDGSSFKNEYATFVLSDHKVIVFVSTGSGKKLDAQFEQPFLQELINLIKLHKPALVFTNRLDRTLRRMLTGAELLKVLENVEGVLGDSNHGIRGADGFTHLMTLMEAIGSEKEAAAIPKKTRDGMVAKTDLKMINGSTRFAVMNTPPAGTIRMTLKNDRGTSGAKMLYLDDPMYYPNQSDVVIGFPTRSKSQKTSNLELVRWALRHLGLPGYTQSVVGAYLAAQGFSTPGIRQKHGVDACFEPTELTERRYLPVRAILTNLEFYETGNLWIGLGVEEVADFEITNCLPPSGLWAQPADFKRIRNYIGECTGGGPGVLSLVGVSVQTNGGACRLLTAHRRENLERPGYILYKVDKEQPRRGFPVLPHDVLAESLVSGLMKAAETVWIPIESQADQINPGLQAEINKLRKSLEFITDQCSMIINQIEEMDEFGRPLLDPSTRQALGVRRSEILTGTYEPVRKQIEELEHALFSEMEDHSRQSEAAPVNLLNELIASLKDPSNTTYNQMWKTCLRIEKMIKVDSIFKGHSKVALSWNGILKISTLSNSFEIPFSGSYVVGSITKVEERVLSTIALMGKGIPIRAIEMPQMRELKSSVAQALGQESRNFNLGSCLDPRILKIGVFVINQPEMSDEEIGIYFDEPKLLIARIRESFMTQPFGCRWVNSASVIKSNWFHIAGQNQGRVTQIDLLKLGSSNWIQNLSKMRIWALKTESWLPSGQMSAQLAPCEYCDSFRRSASRLFEPVGMVCLDCHLDEAGLLWPSDPYDQWLYVAGM